MIAVCEYHHECIHEDEKPKKKQEIQLEPQKEPTPEEIRTAELIANAKFGQIFDMLNAIGNE